jgi:hypothetical protein
VFADPVCRDGDSRLLHNSRQLPPVVSAEYHFDEHRTSTADLKLLAVEKGQSPIVG